MHVGQAFWVSCSVSEDACFAGFRIMKSPTACMSSHMISPVSPDLFSTLRNMPSFPTVKATSLTVPTRFPSLSMIFMPMSFSFGTLFSF